MDQLYSYGGVRLISTEGVARRFVVPPRTLTDHAAKYGYHEVFGVRIVALHSTERGTWGWVATLVEQAEQAEQEMQQWRDSLTD